MREKFLPPFLPTLPLAPSLEVEILYSVHVLEEFFREKENRGFSIIEVWWKVKKFLPSSENSIWKFFHFSSACEQEKSFISPTFTFSSPLFSS
jgi:hypothetical protein